jgi:hypothetical protein
MSASAPVEFSHRELSLLLFVLEGGETASASESPPSCEESCPIVEDLEELFGGNTLPHEKQLARHLGNHLREALVECGMFELMGARAADAQRTLSPEEQAKLREINERLTGWRCEIKLGEPDKKVLGEAMSRLPRAAWISMPRTLWRLKKKLKTR